MGHDSAHQPSPTVTRPSSLKTVALRSVEFQKKESVPNTVMSCTRPFTCRAVGVAQKLLRKVSSSCFVVESDDDVMMLPQQSQVVLGLNEMKAEAAGRFFQARV